MDAVREPMMGFPRTAEPPEWFNRTPTAERSARLSRELLLQPKSAVKPVPSAAEASLRYTRFPTEGRLFRRSPVRRKPRLDAVRSLSTMVFESLASRSRTAAAPHSAAGTCDSHRRV